MEEDDIRDCCYRIICLYQRKKVIIEDLEEVVDKLKQIQDEKKKEAKLQNSLSTMVNSPISQPTSPHRNNNNNSAPACSRSNY